jgi:hypothetical protein
LYEDDDNDREWLGWWEKRFIRKLETKCPNGYNMTDGGDGGAMPMTEEHRRRIAIARTGKKRPAAFCKKMRELSIGRSVSEDTRMKISSTLKETYVYHDQTGFRHSLESKAKMSAAKKGKPKPEGFGEKISKIKTGVPTKPCTEERRAFLRNLYKGKSYEEIYGVERAEKEREKRRRSYKRVEK